MLTGILAAVLLVILALLLWVLFAPLSIKADTYSNEYYLSWGGIGKAEFIPLPDDILIRLRLAFWKKELYPLHPSPPKAKKKPHKKEHKGGGPLPLRRMISVLKTFEIRDFRLEVDTDDYVWNACLYPVFYWIKPLQKYVALNFQGRNECRLLIRNRVWRMAWGWWKG